MGPSQGERGPTSLNIKEEEGVACGGCHRRIRIKTEYDAKEMIGSWLAGLVRARKASNKKFSNKPWEEWRRKGKKEREEIS